MNKGLALKAAVAVSIIGITLLFVLSKFIAIEPINIKDIDERMIGKTVLVKGEVTKISSSNRTLIYVDNSTIPMVIFSKVEVDKNTGVLITGRIDEYREGLQVLVDRIEVVK